MTENRDAIPGEFIARLEALYEAPAPGLEDQAFEARLLKRLAVRRRLRRGVLAAAGLGGLMIACGRLIEVRGSIAKSGALFEVAGNYVSQGLYVSLASGVVGAAMLCVALTVLGLAFARLLEEV